jgi:hypothetical protein
MKYKYAYSLLEAACALGDADYQNIATAMSASDTVHARTAMEEATAACRSCTEAIDCPTWRGYAEDRTLVCPQGYNHPPSSDISNYVPKRRHIPDKEEAPGEVIELCQLLSDALASGTLAGTPDAISRANLIAFWELHYPTDKPAFLFDAPPDAVPLDSDLLLIIAALLSQLKAVNARNNQDNVAADIAAILGPGFGETKLKHIFAHANNTLAVRRRPMPNNRKKTI